MRPGGMEKQMRRVAYLSVLLPLLTMSLWAEEENQEPVVTNPIAKQLDYEHVLISYDVEDGDGDLMTVSIKVSDDGGKTFGFTAPLEQLSGDVGEGVSSGKGKEIVWRIGVDEFLHVYGENYVIRVLADDGVKPVLGEKIVWEKDGSEMMLIPGGTFEMGDHHDNMMSALPIHTVTLDDFYMDSTEVTNAQYRVFIEQTGHRKPSYWTNSSYNQLNQPVVGVDWYDAMAYSQWAGKRLPTEAEWEYAARGNLEGKLYPWGDNVSRDNANYLNPDSKHKWYKQAAPVGSFATNGFGLLDVAGNVWEWCLDSYDNRFYRKRILRKDPISARLSIEGITENYARIASNRILRGGSWHSAVGNMRVAYRYNSIPRANTSYVGFRCVANVD